MDSSLCQPRQQVLESSILPLLIMTGSVHRKCSSFAGKASPMVTQFSPFLDLAPCSVVVGKEDVSFPSASFTATATTHAATRRMMNAAFACQPPPRKRQKLVSHTSTSRNNEMLRPTDSASSLASTMSNHSRASSSTSSTSFTTTSCLQQQRKRHRRRRVQIHPTTTVHEPIREHEIVLFENKPDLWYTQEDFTLTLLNMRKAIKQAQQWQTNPHSHAHNPPDAVAKTLPEYGESLTCTYLACCVDTATSTTSTLPASITPTHLEQLAGMTAVCRGMETAASTDLAAERSQKRREIIQNVVLVHRTLGMAQPGGDECVRTISEQWTAPSRKFAAAMGLSDTLSALRAYAEDAMQQQQQQKQPRQSAAKGA